jgi:hypothetical protein
MSTMRNKRLPWWVSLTLLNLFIGGIVIASIARADTIIFHDLDDGLTFSHIGSDTIIVAGGCVGEPGGCIIAIFNQGRSFVSSTIGSVGRLLFSEDPQLQFFSDELSISAAEGESSVIIRFESNFGEIPIPCAQVSVTGCQLQETGEPQGFTITWSDGGIDTILMESDPESAPVPEPGSWLLLATCLLGALTFGFWSHLRPWVRAEVAVAIQSRRGWRFMAIRSDSSHVPNTLRR